MWRTALWTMAAAIAALAPAATIANPQGGTIAGGNASINHNSNETTITQTSDRAIINWEKFGISAGETTRFLQPGKGSIALNRVIGDGSGISPSVIDGILTANGGVWLVNPSGVFFGPTARVDVHSLVATTANILDADFMHDTFAFAFPTADANASIINQGTITVGEMGLAALVAPHVRNQGVIEGRQATVILAGVPTFTLDFDGDGLVRFAATSAVTTAPAGASALVENPGTISTPGGTVMLTASAALHVIENVINTSGVVEARGISVQNGKIILDGGEHGWIAVNGTLDTAPGEVGAHAGSITLAGDHITLNKKAVVDAAGSADGGSISLTARNTLGIVAPIIQSGDTDISLQANNIFIRQLVQTGGTIRMRAKSAKTERSGLVSAQRLDLASAANANHTTKGGDVSLATNVRVLAIGTEGPGHRTFHDVNITNTGDLSVGHVDNTGIAADSVLLKTDGTLTLNAAIQTTGSGDPLVLVANRFLNQAGNAALSTSNAGRWLVYSLDPAADARAGLDGTLLYNTGYATSPPGSITTAGNVFAYAQSPPPPPPAAEPADVLEIATTPINTEPLIQVTTPLDRGALAFDSQLIAIAPPADDSPEDDPLFASDGNRELWDLVRGR